MAQSQIDQQLQQAEKANQIFDQNNQGRQNSDQFYSIGKVQMRKKFIFEDGELSDFEMFEYRLNRDSLYFFKEDDVDYRNVDSGIDFIKLPTRQDQPLYGQCCQRITDIKQLRIKDYEFQGFCFKVNAIQIEYLLCDREYAKISQLKEKLEKQTIYSYLDKVLGVTTGPYAIKNQYCIDREFDWSAVSQSKWKCDCGVGRLQSPLYLNSSDTITRDLDYLNFGFKDVVCIKYGILYKQLWFYGDFGYFDHIQPGKISRFKIYKILFKIGKSEHSIDGFQEDHVGELLVYGRNQYSDKAILSVLIEIDEKDQQNVFLDLLNISEWNYDKQANEDDEARGDLGKESLNVLNIKTFKDSEGKVWYPSLEQFVDKEMRYRMQYFYYNGSDSHPPCNEEYQRFVMVQPAKISAYQLDQLKLYGLRKISINEGSNVRQQMARNNRTIVHHAGCPQKIDQQEPSVKPAFVKATVPLEIYAMADQGLTFVGDDIKADSIKKVFDLYGTLGNKNRIVMNNRLQLKYYPNNSAGFPDNIMDSLKQKYIAKHIRDIQNMNNINSQQSDRP